jgi:hypothetical protein
MTDTALAAIVGFVEGRVAATELARILEQMPECEALLTDDPSLPPSTYVGHSVFLYLLGLDWSDAGNVFSAQGALSSWLERHSIPHSYSKDAKDLFGLLLEAQPRWLDVDTKWLQEEVLAKSGGLTGVKLKKWLREELLKRFRYITKPPKWIHSPSWPIGPNGPLVFLGQIDVPKHFHDIAAAYVFHDPISNECKTIIQVA